MKATYIYRLVRSTMPEATDAECRVILQGTDYPLCNLERLEHQVMERCIEFRREKTRA